MYCSSILALADDNGKTFWTVLWKWALKPYLQPTVNYIKQSVVLARMFEPERLRCTSWDVIHTAYVRVMVHQIDDIGVPVDEEEEEDNTGPDFNYAALLYEEFKTKCDLLGPYNSDDEDPMPPRVNHRLG